MGQVVQREGSVAMSVVWSGGGEPKRKRRVLSFDEWMIVVDRILQREVGCTHDDMIDWCYADAYAEGTTAAEAARRAIRHAELM